MTSGNPDQDEEVVAHGREAKDTANTWLLAQRMDDRIEALRYRNWEDFGLPLIVFTVDGYAEVTASHLGHRHHTVQCRVEHPAASTVRQEAHSPQQEQ